MLNDLARAARRAHAQDIPRDQPYAPPPEFDDLPQLEQELYRRIARAVLHEQKRLLPKLLAMATTAFLDEESIETILGRVLEAMGED